MAERYREGVRFEDVAGYSRAVRVGRRIVVSGTADLGADGTVNNPEDTYRQAIASLERAVAAVEALGGRREDVMRTRLYLAPDASWREAARAHSDAVGSVAPANTTVFVAGFPVAGILVEVEIDAEVDADGDRSGSTSNPG